MAGETNIIYCTQCGAANDAANTFCTECGSPLPQPNDPLGELDHTVAVPSPSISWDSPYDPQVSETVPDVREPPTQPQPRERKRMGAGPAVAITLSVITVVAAGAFAIFYFTNPLGLTSGIFANSEAAQQAAAEQAAAAADEQAHREETQAQLDAAQKQIEEAQEQLEETQEAAAAAQQEAEEAKRANEQNSAANVGSTNGSYSSSTPTEARITVVGEDGTSRTAVASLVGDTERVIPDSNYRALTDSEVAAMTDGERYIAWKEIIAAETGYMFINKGLSQYFTSRSWYTPNPDGNGWCEPGVAADNVQKLKDSLDDTWWLYVTSP